MQLSVLFFATLKDRAGSRKISVELTDDAVVEDLKKELADRYPALREALPTALVAINQEFAFDDDPLVDGAEVAFFPPVSGGSATTNQKPTYFSVTTDTLDLDEILEKITSENMEFKKLYDEHTQLDHKVEELNKRHYLTPEEETEKKNFQKQKLHCKDRLEKILEEYLSKQH